MCTVMVKTCTDLHLHLVKVLRILEGLVTVVYSTIYSNYFE